MPHSSERVTMAAYETLRNTIVGNTQIKKPQKMRILLSSRKTIDEASKLIESGFNYICDMEGVKLFSKRK
jgi:hypothetical protein